MSFAILSQLLGVVIKTGLTTQAAQEQREFIEEQSELDRGLTREELAATRQIHADQLASVQAAADRNAELHQQRIDFEDRMSKREDQFRRDELDWVAENAAAQRDLRDRMNARQGEIDKARIKAEKEIADVQKDVAAATVEAARINADAIGDAAKWNTFGSIAGAGASIIGSVLTFW